MVKESTLEAHESGADADTSGLEMRVPHEQRAELLTRPHHRGFVTAPWDQRRWVVREVHVAGRIGVGARCCVFLGGAGRSMRACSTKHCTRLA